MEAAATPLRQPRVSALVGRVIIDSLVVDDPCAADLVRARQDAGEDPARVIEDAIEIGARVLDREQAGMAVEVLRQDLEHASKEVEQRLGQTSEAVEAMVEACRRSPGHSDVSSLDVVEEDAEGLDRFEIR